MNGMHYIRDLMIDRLSVDRTDEQEDGIFRIARDSDCKRFRRMAENRKRQILERMLLDASPLEAFDGGKGTGTSAD
jgi:hypothetical protein